ncbi:MAG: hypothetical protein ACK40G_18425 [Cytophagaceae bacterium]
MRLIKSISLIINYKTFILTGLSVLSSYLCYKYELTAAFPDMLVGIAVVFPVVFSIGSAFNRRENALRHLSDFNGHLITTFYALRDWPSKQNDVPVKYKAIMTSVYEKMKVLFNTHEPKTMKKLETEISDHFSELSALSKELRQLGVQGTEVSRINQYLSKMIIAFDNMKMIHHYRTPVTLRAYSKVFIYMFPIVYGPYFANNFHNFSGHLEYVMPVLYSFILVSLDNIQDHLEHPYDNVGEDDIMIDPEEVIRSMKV